MKIFEFTNNKHLITQCMIVGISVIGVLFVEWSFTMIALTVLMFYIYSILGISLTLHRYYSHKSFEFRSRIVKYIFTLISVLSARGTPRAWALVHRTHHATADTEDDPHLPDKFSIFRFTKAFNTKMKLFLIRDMMTKEQEVIHNYYILVLICWCILLGSISFNLLYFSWVLPVFLNQISQNAWNYFSHLDVGYRNFNTKDNSRNLFILWPFILGEAWHNNHHYSPKDITTKVGRYEFDPVTLLINVVGKNV